MLFFLISLLFSSFFPPLSYFSLRRPLPPLRRALRRVAVAVVADMAREGRSHSGLANVLQQGDGTTCGQSCYRKLADIVAEKATAPEIDSC